MIWSLFVAILQCQTWVPLTTNTNYSLNSFLQLDSSIVMAFGQDGVIAKSINEGINWSVSSIPGGYTVTNSVLVGKKIFVTTSNGKILKSLDTAKTWTLCSTPIYTRLSDIIFISHEVGIAVGDDGVCLRSTDGGENWILYFTLNQGNNRTVYFTTPTTGYIAGGDFDSSNGFIYKTNESGVTWTNITPNPRPPLITDICFIDDLNGFFTTVSGTIGKTTNGGLNWEVGSFTDKLLHSISFANGEEGYAVGGNSIMGVVLLTSDTGNTWIEANLNSSAWLNFVDIFKSGGTYCGGANGKIFKFSSLVNTGEWRYVSTPFNVPVNDLLFYDRNYGMAFCGSGKVFLTTNGGAVWSNQPTPVSSDIFSATHVGDTIIAVGQDGIVIRSLDRGSTWTQSILGNSFRLLCVEMDNSNNLFAVGDFGTIIRSTDLGVTWSAKQSPILTTLRSIDIYNNIFTIVGGELNDTPGKILRSTNNGNSWIDVSPSVPKLLNDVKIISDSMMLSVGISGECIYSTNSGFGWRYTNSTTEHWLYAVEHGSGNRSIIVGGNSSHGIVLESGNLYRNWHLQRICPDQLYAIAMPDERVTYVAGAVGRMLKKNLDIVPVENLSIKGNYESKKMVRLEWSTTKELNNAGFEIERKTSDEWQSIGFVNGHGTSVSMNRYTFLDNTNGIIAPEIQYRLKQIDYDGSVTYSEILTITNLPESYILHQNYPNPFNPSTRIDFSVPRNGHVKLEVFDALGTLVATLINDQLEAGHHSRDFNAAGFSSGAYFYRLTADGKSFHKKMLLIK